MATGSQPLAFAELAFGGLLLTSAITGESIGELLTNGLTPEGKARLHQKAQNAGGFGSGSAPETLPGGGGNPPSEGLEPGHVGTPGSTAPAPGKVGATVGSHPSGRSLLENRAHEVEYGLEAAMRYEHELEHREAKGELTKKQAVKLYQTKFPWVRTWTEELASLTNALK